MRAFLLCMWLPWLCGCKKQDRGRPEPVPQASGDTARFIRYTIKAGDHYTALNTYMPVETGELQFEARFDSTAIYRSQVADNQYDINKLYGFSDNGGAHHQYSARFGWRWSDGALRLFAYVYNSGKVLSEELGAVPIGAVIRCRIAVAGDQYVFYCNEWAVALPRKSTTAAGKGYLLYPYFGGDEAAPHEISIWIKRPLSPKGET